MPRQENPPTFRKDTTWRIFIWPGFITEDKISKGGRKTRVVNKTTNAREKADFPSIVFFKLARPASASPRPTERQAVQPATELRPFRIARGRSLDEPSVVQPGATDRAQCADHQEVDEVGRIAGRLKQFLSAWSKITSDSFILQCLRGYKIEFSSKPIQKKVPIGNSLNKKDDPLMGEVIDNLLKLGAIRKVSKSDEQFISSYFLVPKANKKMRFVLNLKKLNSFIPKEHFKMEDFRTATKLVSEGCFMGSIDLKDAYFLIPLHKTSQRYVCFDWNNNRYEWDCIPFGLNVAPWLYTKIMKPVVNFLRSKNLLSVVYLDDWLCFGNTYDECLQNLNFTVQTLEFLGFIINRQKSNLIPQNRCQFLGFTLDSMNMSIELPVVKRQQIVSLIKELRVKEACSIREFARLVGCIVAACPAIQYGWIYSKGLERIKYLELLKNNLNYSATMSIPQSLSADLDWWEEKILLSSNKIRQNRFVLEIFSDASGSGWGIACNGEVTFGPWNTEELKNHINFLELKAAFIGLQIFCRNRQDCELLLRIDNTTAISYINRMGGIQYPKLNHMARQIWQFCELRNIWIFASYIASKENVDADLASRANNVDTEWELAQWAFEIIIERFGDVEIDLFASSSNRKCERYCSWHPDSDAYCVDAFTIDWRDLKFFAFPPVALILKTIQKIKNDRAQGILIVPFWPSQPWYPLWNTMLVEEPIIFPPNNNLLLSPCRTIQHPLASRMQLMAGTLSGSLTADKVLKTEQLR